MPCRIWAIWVNCEGMWTSHTVRIRRLALWATALALTLIVGSAAAESPADLARRAGLQVFESRHLTLVTDRPPRADDGVQDLPGVFDEAFVTWCRHYGLDPGPHASWRVVGCLMVDRERFRVAGLLPVDGVVPDFENGFCVGDRFWLMDQSNRDYRRHLLLHEGVHAFTLTLRDADAPPWYTEGIAEYLATHRLEHGGDATSRFTMTPIPRRRADVEQLGRIEHLRHLHDAGQAPSLADVFATPPQAHRVLGAYAASWAAVTLLAGHPAYRDAFTATERQPLDRDFTARLQASPGWDATAATRDFDAFVADLDYGYDFERMTIDWSPGQPLAAAEKVAIAADRGWQNTGWSLTTGQRCSFTASGRVTVGQVSACRLESPPDGITLRWDRGRPVGRLLVAQWVEPDDGGRPSFRILAEGSSGTFTAATAGPLYLKLNESPGDLADNAGEYTLSLKPM
ncbi:MAG: hypothetical protein WCR51_07530 [Planctomycetia bacterium]